MSTRAATANALTPNPCLAVTDAKPLTSADSPEGCGVPAMLATMPVRVPAWPWGTRPETAARPGLENRHGEEERAEDREQPPAEGG